MLAAACQDCVGNGVAGQEVWSAALSLRVDGAAAARGQVFIAGGVGAYLIGRTSLGPQYRGTWSQGCRLPEGGQCCQGACSETSVDARAF